MKQMKKKEWISKVWKEDRWLFCLFITYILLLIWVVIFKTRIAWPYVRSQRAWNLIPFYDENFGFVLSMEAILNILVLIPMGLYLQMLGWGWRKTLLCGFLTSFSFEVIQFIFAIGVLDITDLITNTSGTAIGILLYFLLHKLSKNQERLKKVLKTVATVCTALALLGFLLILAEEILWRLGIR